MTRTLLLLTVFTALATAGVNAAPQDPAYVNGPRTTASQDPARVGTAPATARSQDTVMRLRQAEALRQQLASQAAGNPSLPAEQRTTMDQLLQQSDALIGQSWDKLEPGSRDPGRGTDAATGEPAFDSLSSLQHNPQLQQGTQQAKDAIDAMQHRLLPLLQELRDDIDAELDRTGSRKR